MNNDDIRRRLGWAMLEDEREESARHPERAAVKPKDAPAGPSKDELMRALMDGIVLGVSCNVPITLHKVMNIPKWNGWLSNTGKASIIVNGKEIASGESAYMLTDSEGGEL